MAASSPPLAITSDTRWSVAERDILKLDPVCGVACVGRHEGGGVIHIYGHFGMGWHNFGVERVWCEMCIVWHKYGFTRVGDDMCMQWNKG